MSIGDKISNRRKAFGWTQKELAIKLSVSDKTISSWENSRTYPDIERLIQLCDIMNFSLDELLREDYQMVKEIDDAVKEKEQLKKWKGLILASVVLLLGFIVLNVVWVGWRYYQVGLINKVEWDDGELDEEVYVLKLPYHIEVDGLQVFLNRWPTKAETGYLNFETFPLSVAVQDNKSHTLDINSKDSFTFFNGEGVWVKFDSTLTPSKGNSKGEKMTKEDQAYFIEEYQEKIEAFMKAGLVIFNELND